jgi:hypothetical protein
MTAARRGLGDPGGFGAGSGGVVDEFVSGRELSSAFHAEVVSPLLGCCPPRSVQMSAPLMMQALWA